MCVCEIKNMIFLSRSNGFYSVEFIFHVTIKLKSSLIFLQFFSLRMLFIINRSNAFVILKKRRAKLIGSKNNICKHGPCTLHIYTSRYTHLVQWCISRALNKSIFKKLHGTFHATCKKTTVLGSTYSIMLYWQKHIGTSPFKAPRVFFAVGMAQTRNQFHSN